jgi:hypothetical protein
MFMAKDSHNDNGEGMHLRDEVIALACEEAHRKVFENFQSSNIFQLDRDIPLPRIEPTEIVSGKLLGKGSFSFVKEIKHIDLNIKVLRRRSPSSQTITITSGEGRATGSDDEQIKLKRQSSISSFVEDVLSGDCRYVIKNIAPDSKNNAEKLRCALMNMVVETHYLSVIEHPNVIKLHAVGHTDMFCPDNFLVLERLYSTLPDKIAGWKKEMKWKNRTPLLKKVRGKTRNIDGTFTQRLAIGCDMASALEYLHGLK